MCICLSGSTATVTTYKVIEISRKKICKCQIIPKDSQLFLDNGNLAQIMDKNTNVISIPATISYMTVENTLCTVKLDSDKYYNIIDIIGKKEEVCSCS